MISNEPDTGSPSFRFAAVSFRLPMAQPIRLSRVAPVLPSRMNPQTVYPSIGILSETRKKSGSTTKFTMMSCCLPSIRPRTEMTGKPYRALPDVTAAAARSSVSRITLSPCVRLMEQSLVSFSEVKSAVFVYCVLNVLFNENNFGVDFMMILAVVSAKAEWARSTPAPEMPVVL